MTPPRLRFAPSPTGYLHVGGARTALFNWLYARRHHGVFVLRVEDTDVQRSSDEMVTGILDGLRWLGLDWDEGPEVEGPHAPYFQSQRLEKYRAAAEQLLASGHAVQDEGAVRFNVQPGKTTFADLVHGPIEFDNEHIESFVILRSDGHPTYHLSVVVDDIDMAITHVVRGDDHISNTPKQVLLYHALGASPPQFAHVPLIMGPDKKRLSKRHGATSVMEYERQGYTAEGMTNFLALLGWSPGGDEELFTARQLIDRFTLEGISGGNAVFNTEKLDWFNHQHLLGLPDEELLTRLVPLLQQAGLWRQSLTSTEFGWMQRVLALLKPRAKKLTEYVDGLRPFLSDPTDYDADAVAKHLRAPETRGHLEALREMYTAALFDASALETQLRLLADRRGVKAGALIHATRIATTGRMVSPGLFEMLVLLGRDRVVTRLEHLVSFLARA
ncbi:MAG TPA: glutamate--tRNA ligase [Vicinamibacterales bacterium]|nr:glutamate--tRNA ligase [Vicinamibacterales bacterium]